MTLLVVLWMAFLSLVPPVAATVLVIGGLGSGRLAWTGHRWYWATAFTMSLMMLTRNILDRDHFGIVAGLVASAIAAWGLIQRDSNGQEVLA